MGKYKHGSQRLRTHFFLFTWLNVLYSLGDSLLLQQKTPPQTDIEGNWIPPEVLSVQEFFVGRKSGKACRRPGISRSQYEEFAILTSNFFKDGKAGLRHKVRPPK